MTQSFPPVRYGFGMKAAIVFAMGILAILILSGVFFTVDQTQRALVLQFGQPVGGIRETGLHAKIPVIQRVVFFDNRLMEYDVGAAEIYTNDKKNMVVDAYVRWRIADPLLFYQRFKSESSFSVVEEAKRRLGGIIVGELRRELGLHILQDIISQNRGSIMETVTDSSNRKLMEDTQAGLVVIDVRIKRADLPPENQRAVYDRMRTEREQQATKYRSEGRRNGQKIKSEADRKVRETIAEAERQAQIIRGEGDSEAAAVYAQAYGQDPEFYAFKRSLESYQTVLRERAVVVLDPAATEYLRYLGTSASPDGTLPEPAPGGPEGDVAVQNPYASLSEEIPAWAEPYEPPPTPGDPDLAEFRRGSAIPGNDVSPPEASGTPGVAGTAEAFGTSESSGTSETPGTPDASGTEEASGSSDASGTEEASGSSDASGAAETPATPSGVTGAAEAGASQANEDAETPEPAAPSAGGDSVDGAGSAGANP
ncbi:MAG: protease modulator HflC [Deltaproteobacteria bacterium]|jgi:membrane protease subunit HflC|nr:protease modulator HflC [Deltaproteobacteria bacterium]